MLNKPLMGTPIKVSAFAAIMSYRRGRTCLFPNIGWDGAKTSIALAPLPVMGEGEEGVLAVVVAHPARAHPTERQRVCYHYQTN